MILFLLTVAFIIWCVAQGRESRQPVWKARVERVAPLGRYVRADFRATRDYLRRAPAWHPIDWAKTSKERAAFRQIRESFDKF